MRYGLLLLLLLLFFESEQKEVGFSNGMKKEYIKMH